MLVPMPTMTKAQLLKLLEDKPDDAKVYIFTQMTSVNRAVEAANKTGSQDVFFCLAENAKSEADGVSLVAYCGV